MSMMELFADLNRPKVERKEWMQDVDLRLAKDSDLDLIAQECIENGVYGLDLETTGLDQRAFETDTGREETVDKIVGVCVGTSTKKGWYIPVRHREEGASANVPMRRVKAMIEEVQAGGALAVFHNAKFDLKFLLCDPVGQIGEWEDVSSWHCTLVLAYLRNSRERRKGLKYLSKSELDREMIELKELFPPEAVKAKKMDFSTLDPTWDPVVWYAAADAVNTLALYEILHPSVVGKDKHKRSQSGIYKMERACLLATIWMENCRIRINRGRLEDLIRLGQKEWWECIQEVYAEANLILGRDVRPSWVLGMEGSYDPAILDPNYMEMRESASLGSTDKSLPVVTKSVPRLDNARQQETVDFPAVYDLTIPAKLGILLREVGVKGLAVTEKSGQVKTSKDELDRVITEAGDKFPFMVKVKRFREVSKGLGTFLFPIWWDTTPERSPDGCVWASFNGLKVDTGRFSTPTPRDKHKDRFMGQVRWGVHMTPATYDKSKPVCVRKIREVVEARPGYIMFAIDYSGVELRIVTNLSREPKWINEFFRCSSCDHQFDRSALPPPFCPSCGSDKIGDLHSLTALGVHGDKIKGTPEFKQRRQEAKALNFAMAYGGGGSAAQRAVGVDKAEGWRIKRKYDNTYKTLQRWWGDQHRVARDQVYVSTAYGRKYPVPDIAHPDGGFRSKAERNSVNGPVQGTSADIMKLAMAKLYRAFKERGWIAERRVYMTITIHDELVFEIREEGAGDVVDVIEKIMVLDSVAPLFGKANPWIVPLKVDIEFGSNWTVPFNLTEMSWNKGGGEWTERWVKAFPSQYKNYLSCGGEPVEGSVPEVVERGVPLRERDGTDAGIRTPDRISTPAKHVPTKEGSAYVFKMKTTIENAQILARVLQWCQGRGMDLLHVRSADGVDLLGAPVRVAYEEFRIVADYEGLR
jgi:DNA polymerase I-like protein with 3'-5' exonuclease and polymerase domains